MIDFGNVSEILKSLLICEVFPRCSQQDDLFYSDNFEHIRSTDIPALVFHH